MAARRAGSPFEQVKGRRLPAGSHETHFLLGTRSTPTAEGTDHMATILISSYQFAQGQLISREGDRATIRIGDKSVSGRIIEPWRRT